MVRASSLSFLFSLLLMPSQILMADTQHTPLYDQYSLQATAEGEVENDLMQVRMQVQHEDRDAAALATRVNEDMQWALDELKKYSGVSYKTGNYATYPKYEQQRVVGWSSTQTLSLQGSDFEAMKAAVQLLQGRLQVQNMAFLPSDDTRRKLEDELINQALDNLKHRAGIVQQNMGASGFRVIQINIDTGDHYVHQPRMEVSMMRSARADVAPAVEGGESKLTVTVSGQIQLQ